MIKWRIESNTHANAPADAEKSNYKSPGFISNFVKLHLAMWRVNSGFTRAHAYESRPGIFVFNVSFRIANLVLGDWPLLRKGVAYWSAKTGGAAQIHFIGNLIVWTTVFLSIWVYVAFEAIKAVLDQRKVKIGVVGKVFLLLSRSIIEYFDRFN